MTRLRLLSFILFAWLAATAATAQERNIQLTITVSSVEGDVLTGQPVTLHQTDYQVSYGTLVLNAQGQCQVKVYPGNHRLTIERDGFNTFTEDFVVAEGATTHAVSAQLTEKVRTPYSLTVAADHNAYTGKDDLHLTWNTEQPAFFDDFESYTPWAVQFGEWTGIDADVEAAASLLGSYPNRGVMQYAQIINPLTVEPTWWYDYPILRPYAGSQYLGFTRTNSGNANDDWLISPVVSVGNENVLSFMAKAGDQFIERFMVYVTTKLDNPVQSDFIRLDKDNYETADYTGWRQYTYDLSAYAGQQIKFAIRYISEYNRTGSFMLMVDNVFVGQQRGEQTNFSRRAAVQHRSQANPNEVFDVYLDGQLMGSTEDYSYTIASVAAGSHTVGVRAHYKVAQSEMVSQPVVVAGAESYASLTFNVTADSKLSVDGQQITLISTATSQTYVLSVSGGKATIASLPKGGYLVAVAEGAFCEYKETLSLDADKTVDLVLTDRMLTPYNITATYQADGSVQMRWNQELLFADSFEDYDDFATGSFGEWVTVDADQQPVYPVSLNGSIIAFPGSGTQYNPTAIAPMVFNPWTTQPAMLPTDHAIAAPTGNKTIIFFSAQQAQNDKWLISPPIEINEGYQFSISAKAYASAYPESMEFCVSLDASTNPDDFIALSQANPLASEEWMQYTTDLSVLAGKTVRLAVHYTSTDAFMAQVDDFKVGPADGQGKQVDYGNVVRFDIYLDGQKVGQSEQPSYLLPQLSEGKHTVGVKAIYKSGESQMAEYIVDTTLNSIETLSAGQTDSIEVYTLSGVRLNTAAAQLPKGVYVVKSAKGTFKMRK